MGPVLGLLLVLTVLCAVAILAALLVLAYIAAGLGALIAAAYLSLRDHDTPEHFTYREHLAEVWMRLRSGA